MALEILRLYDDILGYTCMSKTKVNQIKEIEEAYTRRQLYECLKNNVDEIKRYLNEKGICEEYGKISYITVCIKNKIQDASMGSLNNTITVANNECVNVDWIEETDDDIIKRLNKANERKEESILDIIRKVNDNKWKKD